MGAPAVTMYATGWCPYCERARALLQRKGVAFSEIDVDDATSRTQMIERSGRRSVPQIFIRGHHIGGCDELHALDAAGELDPLLAAAAADAARP